MEYWLCLILAGWLDITMNDFIKQTEIQKHAPLLKSWKIEYTEMFRVVCIPPGFLHT